MIRTAVLALLSVGAIMLVDVSHPPSAHATPGMVRADGCHGRPRHCHSTGEFRRNTRGRLYVPGAFGGGRGHHHRRGRRR